MKRLGKFSGKTYNEDEIENMNECSVMLSDSEVDNEDFIAERHLNDLKQCLLCIGCPLAQDSMVRCQ